MSTQQQEPSQAEDHASDGKIKELESMVLRYAKSETAVIQKQNKIDELEKKLKRVVKDNETLAAKTKALSNEKTNLTNNLTSRIVQLSQAEQELGRLRELSEDLKQQLDSHKRKEKELTELCKTLSSNKDELKTELDDLKLKLSECSDMLEKITAQLDDTLKQNESLELQVNKLSIRVDELTSTHDKLVCDKEKIQTELDHKVGELLNEIRVIKKKHVQNTKELNRELKTLRAQTQAAETTNTPGPSLGSSEATGTFLPTQVADIPKYDSEVGHRSPTESQTSSRENNESTVKTSTAKAASINSLDSLTNSSGEEKSSPIKNVDFGVHVDLDKELDILKNPDLYRSLSECGKPYLIDMILKLQNQVLKKDDRVDVLQEQVNMLIEEVKKKGQLLTHYILREDSDSFSTKSLHK